jgi:hypothetical protein
VLAWRALILVGLLGILTVLVWAVGSSNPLTPVQYLQHEAIEGPEGDGRPRGSDGVPIAGTIPLAGAGRG